MARDARRCNVRGRRTHTQRGREWRARCPRIEPVSPVDPDANGHRSIIPDRRTRLERNPGIGASKGTTMAGATEKDLEDELIDGANTFEGDVDNDATLGGGADPRRTGRHNK